MVAWSLSVALTGNGDALARTLRQSATAARDLSRDLNAVRRNLTALGGGAGGLRTLTTGLRGAGTLLRDVRHDASGASRDLRSLGAAANRAATATRANTAATRDNTADLRSMQRQLQAATRDLTALARAARSADTRLGTVGSRGTHSLGQMDSAASRLRSRLAGLTGLLAGGALVFGLHDLVEQGNEYQKEMNQFGAVTGANAVQMQYAAAVAKQLGSDLTLPATTAKDAAEAMVDLAKAGFRADQAIIASRPALELSTGLHVKAADAAMYLGDVMDQFGLGANQAGKAADTLAATATGASGGIRDIWYAMKYAGPVANALGVSLQDTAAAVVGLGKSGIIGQTAGTTLRGALSNLAAPTKQMRQGLAALGIEAFDSTGKFKGLATVIDGLNRAQHRMTQQDYIEAVKKAFGKPGMSGMVALGHQGLEAFQAGLDTVSQYGKAAQIAAAQSKGLTGAMTQLKTQARTTGLEIYSSMAPGLEWLTRGLTSGLARATPYITAGINYAHDLATVYGPSLAEKANAGLGGLMDKARELIGPLRALGEHALADGLNLLINAGRSLMDVLGNVADGLAPIGHQLARLGGDGSSAASTLDIVVLVVNALASAVGWLSGVLVPVGQVVGTLVGAFGALPGPIQTALASILLWRRVGPMLSGLAGTVRGSVTGAFASFNAQMTGMRLLASASGTSLSRFGAAFAVLQARVPLLAAMATSFRTASTAGSGFTGTLNGMARAAGTGLAGAMRGLMGIMGGPWGIALLGITVGLGMLASYQQKAAQAAAEHQQRIADLTRALRDSGGVIDTNVRAAAAQTLLDYKLHDSKTRLVDVMEQSGTSMRTLTDAYLGQGSSLEALEKKYRDLAEANKAYVDQAGGKSSVLKYTDTGERYKRAADALKDMRGEMEQSVTDAKRLAEAQNPSGRALSAYDKLKLAVKDLADTSGDADRRTRGLKDALDLLGGGSVSVQAAQARLNEAILNAGEAVDEGIKKSGDYGKVLLGLNGTLNTTTRNGQQLFSSLNGISDAAASAALAAYDFAQKSDKTLPESLNAARTEMDKARDAAIKLLGQYGIVGDEAGLVADKMGLIPGRVSILLQTKGMGEALAELLAVQAEFARFPDKRTVKVDALGDDAKKELQDLHYAVELIPSTREYKITAPTLAARAELDALIAKMSAVPDKSVRVNALTADGIANLQNLQGRINATQGRTFTMTALTADARAALLGLGFTIQNTNGKTVEITIPTGTPTSAAASIQGAIDSVHGKTVSVRVNYSPYVNVGPPPPANPYLRTNANGNVYSAPGRVLAFADGGMRESHVAQIARGGEYRVWAERETQGESYIPHAPSKRPRSRRILEETVRRLGGDPASITWYANGGGTGTNFSYTPASLNTLSSVASSSQDKDGKFDLGVFAKKLHSSVGTAQRWRNELATVAARAGTDVAKALEAMGEDGVDLVHKMATGSRTYLNQMASDLRGLANTAKASLADYTRELTTANNTNADFQKNLIKLAGMGFGDLAAQLNQQGDAAAQDLAAQAVRDRGKASQANTQAKTAGAQLTSDETGEIVQIIGAVTSSKVGLHQVADTTTLAEDEIIRVLAKAGQQVKTALGDRGSKLLDDLSRAQRGLSYADGGIREGIYATSNGLVRFAEPSTGGEAYLPLGLSKRPQATNVLGDVASRFGYALVGRQDASAGRVQVIVIQQAAPLIGTQTIQIDRPGATEQQIAAAIGYQVRRAQRGGVRR
ncbi:phage tail tape measure protein [Streptomyces sp. Edi4]|uniref:phage tail tape measure protein n=1 Tax=Streptomyces sp. Edi4 TaxID=3162527 RepID=UPI003305A1E8